MSGTDVLNLIGQVVGHEANCHMRANLDDNEVTNMSEPASAFSRFGEREAMMVQKAVPHPSAVRTLYIDAKTPGQLRKRDVSSAPNNIPR